MQSHHALSSASRRTLHPSRRKCKDDNKAMSPTTTNILSERPHGQQHQERPQDKLLIENVRRKNHLTEKYNFNDLKELDETVASVGRQYKSSQKGGADDESQSMGSQTISTLDGHSVQTYRHLIDNMRDMNRSIISVCHSLKSSRSKSKSTVSKKSRSSQSRRRRGASLERMIEQTILESIAHNDKHVEPFETTECQQITPTSSIEFILKDLCTVDTILESEARSQTNEGLTANHHLEDRPNSHRFNPLLPPIISASFASQDDDPLPSLTPSEGQMIGNCSSWQKRALERIITTEVNEDHVRCKESAVVNFFESSFEAQSFGVFEDTCSDTEWPFEEYNIEQNKVKLFNLKDGIKMSTENDTHSQLLNHRAENSMWVSSSGEDWSIYNDESTTISDVNFDETQTFTPLVTEELKNNFSKHESDTRTTSTKEPLGEKVGFLDTASENAKYALNIKMKDSIDLTVISLSRDEKENAANQINKATVDSDIDVGSKTITLECLDITPDAADSEWMAELDTDKIQTLTPVIENKRSRPIEDIYNSQSNQDITKTDGIKDPATMLGWTSFEANPFSGVTDSDSDESPASDFWVSDASPTAASDFWAIRQWKSSERGWKSPPNKNVF